MNTFRYDVDKIITIPTGSYTIEDINAYLQEHMKPNNIMFQHSRQGIIKQDVHTNPPIIIRVNRNTLKSEIYCEYNIDFNHENSLAELLGFKKGEVLDKLIWNVSNYPVKITKINDIKIECNITAGAYSNNQAAHTLHEFSPDVPPGFKLSEAPRSIIYMPVSVRVIDNITLRIVDQHGRLINFRGEEITTRLHLKEF